MASPVKHRNKWRIRWVDERGQRQSESYERFEDAEFMLKRHEVVTEEIRRGLKLGLPPKKSFNDLADYWLTVYAPSKRSFEDDRSIIERHLRPKFGRLALSAIGTGEFDEYWVSHRHLAPKTISNHVILLKSMLNRAVDLKWLHAAPRFKVPSGATSQQDFSYLRNDDEIRRFLVAAKETDTYAYMLYKTAIFTGMRAGELAGLTWSDIDFSRRLITVQRSFTGPTKTSEVRRIPIFDVLFDDLRAWALERPCSDVVFPNRANRPMQESDRLFQEVLHRVLDKAGFPPTIRRGRPAHYIRFHDLRHTFASHWMMNGGDIFKLQKLLGHKTMAMTLRYSHLSPDAFAGDYAHFGGRADMKPEGVLHTLHAEIG